MKKEEGGKIKRREKGEGEGMTRRERGGEEDERPWQ